MWKGERKRDSESMWSVKGSANGRYVKDERERKERKTNLGQNSFFLQCRHTNLVSWSEAFSSMAT